MGVPFGLCLSIEPDREGLLCVFELFGGVDWPLGDWSIEAEAGALADAPGICRGRAGGEFFWTFSLGAPWVIQLTSTPCTCSMLKCWGTEAERDGDGENKKVMVSREDGGTEWHIIEQG